MLRIICANNPTKKHDPHADSHMHPLNVLRISHVLMVPIQTQLSQLLFKYSFAKSSLAPRYFAVQTSFVRIINQFNWKRAYFRTNAIAQTWCVGVMHNIGINYDSKKPHRSESSGVEYDIPLLNVHRI